MKSKAIKIILAVIMLSTTMCSGNRSKNDSRSSEELVIIDKNKIKEWSAPFRNWYYYPDHVILAKPNIKGFEDISMTDVPTVFQLDGSDKWYNMFYCAVDKNETRGIGLLTSKPLI